MSEAAFKELESDDQVPTYLKEALVSEIDLIRDTLQFVTHFTNGFFSTALAGITQITEPEP